MEETTIDKVLQKMRQGKTKTSLITAKKKPTGIITKSDIVKFFQDNHGATLDKIPVSDIMNKKVISITNNSSDLLLQCAMRMEMFRIGTVVISDENGFPQGVVTQKDVIENFYKVFPKKATVQEYMKRNVPTCRNSDSVGFALNIMQTHGACYAIVTDNNGRPLGIITREQLFESQLGHGKKSSKTSTASSAQSYRKLEKLDTSTPVQEFILMQQPVIVADADLADSARLLIGTNHGVMPVVYKEGNIAGTISGYEVIRAYNKLYPLYF